MFNNLKRLRSYRELILTFTYRDIRIRYKQSHVGILWVLIQPVVTMLILTIVFSKFARINTGNIPYSIFAFSALLPWNLFAGSLSAAVPSLVANMGLVSKIYFPREVIPISVVLARMFDFIIISIFFVCMTIFYKVGISKYLLFLPVLMLIQLALTLGIVFLGSALNVIYRDVSQLVPLVLQIWMYLSPIIYPVSLVPVKYQGIYMLNPMAPIIDGYRKCILEHTLPNLHFVAISASVSVVAMIASYIYFKRTEKIFADII